MINFILIFGFYIYTVSTSIAGYTVKSFNNGANCVAGCKFESLVACRAWINSAHSYLPYSKCENTDTEDNQAAADILEAKNDRTAVKGMISNINNSTKPVWEKRMLKRLIKEMRD